jgi:hypothetical protein
MSSRDTSTLIAQVCPDRIRLDVTDACTCKRGLLGDWPNHAPLVITSNNLSDRTLFSLHTSLVIPASHLPKPDMIETATKNWANKNPATSHIIYDR